MWFSILYLRFFFEILELHMIFWNVSVSTSPKTYRLKKTKLRDRPRPPLHAVGEMWKPSFNSTLRPDHADLSVKKTELFENALQTGGIWLSRLCIWVSRETFLKTEPLRRKQLMTPRLSYDFHSRVFLKRKFNTAGDSCVFKFLQCSADGKHVCKHCFQIFRECSVNRAPIAVDHGFLVFLLRYVVLPVTSPVHIVVWSLIRSFM